MHFETTLICNEPLIRRAVFAFWRRSLGVGGGYALLVAMLTTAFVIADGREWVAGAVATLLGVAIAVILAVFVVHYRNALATLREMGTAKAIVPCGRNDVHHGVGDRHDHI